MNRLIYKEPEPTAVADSSIAEPVAALQTDTIKQGGESVDGGVLGDTSEEAGMGLFAKLVFFVLICVILVLVPKLRRSPKMSEKSLA